MSEKENDTDSGNNDPVDTHLDSHSDKSQSALGKLISEELETETPSVEQAQAKTRKAKKPGASVKKAKILLIIFLLLIGCLVAAAAWYVHLQTATQKNDIAQEISRLESHIAENRQSASTLGNRQNAFLNQVQQQERQLLQRMQQLEQSIQAQQKKILSLSTSTQDDWILAEAEYLLRLANQRVLIEGNARSALALLEKVDDIVLGLDDPDLMPLRQQLATDLAKLRLVKEVDLEGIYFSLGALAKEVDKLELKPSRKNTAEIEGTDEVTLEEVPTDGESEETQSWWQKISKGLGSSFSGLDNYIRISWHDEAKPKLLTPENALYLKQNLRLKLERAQLALLREEPAIYQSSLSEVATWLRQYFPATGQRENFIEQVEKLATRKIVQTLPDISASLKLLQSHIAMLHDLNPENSNKPAVETTLPSMQTEETL